MSKFQERLANEGYCDSRCAGFCATATVLPQGEKGMVCLCVKDDLLNLYEVLDIRSNLGALLYSVKLNGVENLKIRCNIFSQVLSFEYMGCFYSFTNFLGVKPALEVIKEEAAKR